MESEKIPGFGAYILALFLTPIYCLTRGKWVGFILSTLLYIAAGLTIFMFGLGLIPWALAALPAAFSLRNEILEAHARKTGEATAKAIAAVMPVKTEGHLPQPANIAQQAAKAPPPPESTPTPAEDKICPMCAETVKVAARICKHCRHEFDLEEESKLAAAGTVEATFPQEQVEPIARSTELHAESVSSPSRTETSEAEKGQVLQRGQSVEEMAKRNGDTLKVICLIILATAAVLVAYFNGFKISSPPLAKQGIDDLIKIKLQGKYGFVDKTGKVIIQPQYIQATSFHEGVAAITIPGGLVGFIDKSGNNVIKCQFDQAGAFSEGLASVKIANRFGYIDKTGKIVISPAYDSAQDFHDGMAVVKKDNLYGFIDQKGNPIVPPRYKHAIRFFDGLAVVALDNKGFGHIDKTGKIVIPFQFDGVSAGFKDGVSSASVNDRYGFIDKSGRFFINPKYDAAGNFFEGLASVKLDNKYGFIDKTDTVKIPFQYDKASKFSEGLAAVKLGDKYGYIDKSGNMAIPPLYDTAYDFGDGTALVKMGEKQGVIDKKGKYIWNPTE